MELLQILTPQWFFMFSTSFDAQRGIWQLRKIKNNFENFFNTFIKLSRPWVDGSLKDNLFIEALHRSNQLWQTLKSILLPNPHQHHTLTLQYNYSTHVWFRILKTWNVDLQLFILKFPVSTSSKKLNSSAKE